MALIKRHKMAFCFLGGLLLCTTVAYTQIAYRSPSTEALKKRVDSYYGALESSDFDAAWQFFEAGMRRDNPKEKFVKTLRKTVGWVKVATDPEVWVETESVEGLARPVGKAIALIDMRGADVGSRLLPRARHITTWVWEKSPDTGSDWFLVRDEMKPAASRK